MYATLDQKVLIDLARVSLCWIAPILLNEVHLLVQLLVPEIIPNWRNCVLDLKYTIRSQIDFLLGISQPKMLVLDYLKKLYDVNFDDWSNYGSCWESCVRSGSWVCPRK